MSNKCALFRCLSILILLKVVPDEKLLRSSEKVKDKYSVPLGLFSDREKDARCEGRGAKSQSKGACSKKTINDDGLVSPRAMIDSRMFMTKSLCFVAGMRPQAKLIWFKK